MLTVLSQNKFKKKFYPVIHCIDPFERKGVEHAFVNIRIAIENEADGVFLIGHGMVYMDLFSIYEQAIMGTNNGDSHHLLIGIVL